MPQNALFPSADDPRRAEAAERRRRAIVPTVALALPLSGCAGAAPSLVLFGAYFPGWMLCALVGVAGAAGARAVMVALGLAQVVPYQLFVCVAVGVIVATATWLLWFGR